MFEDKVGKSHIDILRTKKQAVTPVLAQMVGSNSASPKISRSFSHEQ